MASLMIPAVAQTLAEILAGGTSLISTEQIDFSHPTLRPHTGQGLNLYCYDLRQRSRGSDSERQKDSNNSWGNPHKTTENCSIVWFDVSFLVSAWDDTALGEQRLLSEALMLLLRHPFLEEEFLAPALRGFGSLPISVCTAHSRDTPALWSALGVPLRPALYVTVTTPVNLSGAATKPKLYFSEGFTEPNQVKASF